MNDNQNNSNDIKNKPDTIIQILIGLGIALIAYVIVIGLASFADAMAIIAIITFAMLALYGFLIVRFFRTSYKATAITMLVLVSPLLVFLLLFGACALVMMPF